MEKVETLIRVADRMGIERLGLFLRPGKEAKEIQEVLVRYRNKVFGFLWMTLWNDTIESHIDALNRWVEQGAMVGMKMAGGDGVCSLAVYDPVFRRAGELKASITSIPGSSGRRSSHSGRSRRTLLESKPQDVAALASATGNSFICGHTGGDLGTRRPGCPPVEECFRRDWRKLSYAGNGGTGGEGVRDLGGSSMEAISGRSFASQLAQVYGSPISDRKATNLQRQFATDLVANQRKRRPWPLRTILI
jgi:hypothetical protein